MTFTHSQNSMKDEATDHFDVQGFYFSFTKSSYMLLVYVCNMTVIVVIPVADIENNDPHQDLIGSPLICFDTSNKLPPQILQIR